MLRSFYNAAARSIRRPAQGTPWAQPSRELVSRHSRPHEKEYSEEEYAKAREWQATFNSRSLPNKLAHVRFDRSSGAGGQNVNKSVYFSNLISYHESKLIGLYRVATKATCSWPIAALEELLPPMVFSGLRSSRYYAANSQSLIISSQRTRKQKENEEDCHEKLADEIKDLSRQLIPGETSVEQLAKVEQL
jgi:peptidyl-tRNA hydrolase ICT1